MTNQIRVYIEKWYKFSKNVERIYKNYVSTKKSVKTLMIIIEKEEKDENPTIELKKTTSKINLCSQQGPPKTLRQVQQITYVMGQQQYQIKVSHHLHSWDIPYRYYQHNMDPVKAFLQNNTIRNHNSRMYWNNKNQFYF